ncbi:N-acylneuraminate cytidylyltransferase [Stieleria neptunia]|uniref:N-acylneuraminate cytidylyltransferase n=1 Tax=Stieleria neptunia TaxID=2527979 RepID=A0A518HTM6_9BACT|nr:acylneuraminate cytidylyltransferase family protein [Stieleria neptunia]QDV44209.1 N-acylneuraminate cytidylyltransferase [Stieleria neptunia]
MMNGQNVLAVIPARQNSKGLPGKNTIGLAGKPLIAYTIEAARASCLVDEVVVSTDGEAIRDIAIGLGASVPFLRPAELATDDTPGVAAVLHACHALPGYDLTVVLQPTSPLRNEHDIDAAIRRLEERNADFCVSVTPAKHHPNWLFKEEGGGFLSRYEDKPISGTRQSLDKVFALNGAIYVARTDQLKRQQTLFGRKTTAYIMTPDRSYDIDTELDLRICEMVIRG